MPEARARGERDRLSLETWWTELQINRRRRKVTPPDWRKMAVQITPTAIQHTGMTASPAGSVAAWQVTFQLDAEKLLRVAISIPVAGPTTHHEAQLEALKILQVFLGDACDAAKKYQFS